MSKIGINWFIQVGIENISDTLLCECICHHHQESTETWLKKFFLLSL